MNISKGNFANKLVETVMEYREQVGENEKFNRSLQSVSTQAFLKAVPSGGRWRAV
jgi:hypothetical protein